MEANLAAKTQREKMVTKSTQAKASPAKDWVAFYRPDLPIAIFLINEEGQEKECFNIAPENGPLFMTLTKLPLRDKAVAGGMVVPVAVLEASGIFANYANMLSRYTHARIVLNNPNCSRLH